MFVMLPLVFNNGIIIQFGGATPGTVVFPIAFTVLAKISVCPQGGGANPGSHIDNPNNTSVYIDNGNHWGMHWIAIGY